MRLLTCFLLTVSCVPVSAQYITGYAGNWSNVSGDPIEFHLSGAPEQNAELTVYDVLADPLVQFNVDLERQEFDEDNLEPWKNGFGWEPTSVNLPALPSGLYYLNGPDVGSDYVPFIITEPERKTDIVVVYPTNTVNAYSWSPNFNSVFPSPVNLYSVGSEGARPELVSFQRPQNRKVWVTAGVDRWLRRQDEYSYKYIADSDLEDFASIADADLVIVPGHSEYWTEQARRNFDRFVDNGGPALVLSGNTMYRKVEYDNPEEPTELQFSPRRAFTDASLDYQTYESIGADFFYGGFGSAFNGGRAKQLIDTPYEGYKLLDTSKSYFEGVDLEVGDLIFSPSQEYDGVPFTSLDPITGPVIDEELLGFHRIDLIGFDNAVIGQRKTVGTWIDFRKTLESGRIINVGSIAWARFGVDSVLESLTANMVSTLLMSHADFDDDDMLSANDIDLLFDNVGADSASQVFDLTDDGEVTIADIDRWLTEFAKTRYGDADLDGTVGFSDLLQVGSNFEKPGRWGDGDFDGDGRVTFSDFLRLSTNYQVTAASIRTVPEPAVSPILAFCLCLVFAGLRKRVH